MSEDYLIKRDRIDLARSTCVTSVSLPPAAKVHVPLRRFKLLSSDYGSRNEAGFFFGILAARMEILGLGVTLVADSTCHRQNVKSRVCPRSLSGAARYP